VDDLESMTPSNRLPMDSRAEELLLLEHQTDLMTHQGTCINRHDEAYVTT
jgi:hypothetical protein